MQTFRHRKDDSIISDGGMQTPPTFFFRLLHRSDEKIAMYKSFVNNKKYVLFVLVNVDRDHRLRFKNKEGYKKRQLDSRGIFEHLRIWIVSWERGYTGSFRGVQ